MGKRIRLSPPQVPLEACRGCSRYNSIEYGVPQGSVLGHFFLLTIFSLLSGEFYLNCNVVECLLEYVNTFIISKYVSAILPSRDLKG